MTELQTKFYDKIMEEYEKYEEDVLKYSKQDILDSVFSIVYFKEAHCLLRNMCEDGELPNEIMEKALEIDDFTECLGDYMLNCDEDPIYNSWRYDLNHLWGDVFERIEEDY